MWSRGVSPPRPLRLPTALVSGLVLLGILVTAIASVPVDPALPSYQRVGDVVGTLTSLGSETLSNLMTLWAEGFRVVYPRVVIRLKRRGPPRPRRPSSRARPNSDR